MIIDTPPNIEYYQLDNIASRAGIPSNCVFKAAAEQNVPAAIMFAVLVVEGGKVGSERMNRDGSVDLGPAQINANTWIPELNNIKYNRTTLRDDGCINIEAAAKIMSFNLNESKSFWRGVGRYHSGTPKHNLTYRLLIYRALIYIKKAYQFASTQ